jgi:hypothetical protein
VLWPPDWLLSLVRADEPGADLPEAFWGDYAADLQRLRIEPLVTEGKVDGLYATDDDFRLAAVVLRDQTRSWLQAVFELRSRVLHS